MRRRCRLPGHRSRPGTHCGTLARLKREQHGAPMADVRTRGTRGRAIPLYEQAPADSVRVLGEDHPQTKIVRGNLAAAPPATSVVAPVLRPYQPRRTAEGLGGRMQPPIWDDSAGATLRVVNRTILRHPPGRAPIVISGRRACRKKVLSADDVQELPHCRLPYGRRVTLTRPARRRRPRRPARARAGEPDRR